MITAPEEEGCIMTLQYAMGLLAELTAFNAFVAQEEIEMSMGSVQISLHIYICRHVSLTRVIAKS